DALNVVEDILDARSTGVDSPPDQRASGSESALVDALERVRDLGPEWNASEIESACATLRSALDTTDGLTQTMVERIEETILPALATARVALDDNAGLGGFTPPDHIGGDLTAMVEDAVD